MSAIEPCPVEAILRASIDTLERQNATLRTRVAELEEEIAGRIRHIRRLIHKADPSKRPTWCDEFYTHRHHVRRDETQKYSLHRVLAGECMHCGKPIMRTSIHRPWTAADA